MYVMIFCYLSVSVFLAFTLLHGHGTTQIQKMWRHIYNTNTEQVLLLCDYRSVSKSEAYVLTEPAP